MRTGRTLTATALALALAAGGAVAIAAPASANAGCTYTQGYYKTHWTGAQIDAFVAQGSPNVVAAILAHTGLADLSAVYNTPPRGDAYLIAADQWITAAINGSAGEAGFQPPLDAAYYGLATYFQHPTWYTRDQVIAWATLLDQYNNGLLNLPHC